MTGSKEIIEIKFMLKVGDNEPTVFPSKNNALRIGRALKQMGKIVKLIERLKIKHLGGGKTAITEYIFFDRTLLILTDTELAEQITGNVN